MTDHTQARTPRYLAFIPVLLLLLIAGIQIYLAKTADLTPWKGGGFGMFSTTDGNSNRFLRIIVSAPQRSEELLLRGDLEIQGAKAQMFPGDEQLETLAKSIIQDQQRKNLPVETVQIEVWRVEFRKEDLHPSEKRLRDFTYSVKAQ